MKRFISIVLVAALFFSLSVSSFAVYGGQKYLNSDATYSKYTVNLSDGNTYFGTFLISDAEASVQDFWFSFISESIYDGSTDYEYFVILSTAIDIYRYPKTESLNFINFGGPTVTSMGYKLSSGVFFEKLRFNFSSNSYTASKVSTSSTASLTNSTSLPLFTTDFANHDVFFDYDLTTSSSQKIYEAVYDGQLGFIDDIDDEVIPPFDGDGGEDDGGNSSGSDDGESGSGGVTEPEEPPIGGNGGIIDLPQIDNSNVPYDLSVWDTVLSTILPQLKKVFTVAFPIFLIFLGVTLLMRVIRLVVLGWFGGSKKGGSNISVDD